MNTTAAAAPPPVPRRRGRFFWPLQVLPPLLLILLLLTGNGPGFWFTLAPLLIVGFVCVLSVLIRLVFLVFRRGDPARIVRPLLAIAVVVGANFYCSMSRNAAAAIVGAEAKRVQAECVRAGKCPEAIELGSSDGGYRRWITPAGAHLTWPLSYRVSEEGFELTLHEGMDTDQRWSGGPGRELVREAVLDGHAYPLPLDGPSVGGR